MFKKIEKQKLIILVAVGIVAVLVIIKMIDNNYNDNNNTISTNIFSQSEMNLNDEEKIIVYITGEVKNQGVIELDHGSRISNAIEKAGGLTENANIKNVNLAYELEDGQKIYIPNINEETQSIINDKDNAIDDSGDTIININKADSSELQSLNGIGESLAKSILKYRDENGKFNKIEDLMNVPGIGEAKFNNIRDSIKVK